MRVNLDLRVSFWGHGVWLHVLVASCIGVTWPVWYKGVCGTYSALSLVGNEGVHRVAIWAFVRLLNEQNKGVGSEQFDNTILLYKSIA